MLGCDVQHFSVGSLLLMNMYLAATNNIIYIYAYVYEYIFVYMFVCKHI